MAFPFYRPKLMIIPTGPLNTLTKESGSSLGIS